MMTMEFIFLLAIFGIFLAVIFFIIGESFSAKIEHAIKTFSVIFGILSFLSMIFIPIMVTNSPKQVLMTRVIYPIVNGKELSDYPEYEITTRQEFIHIYYDKTEVLSAVDYLKMDKEIYNF